MYISSDRPLCKVQYLEPTNRLFFNPTPCIHVPVKWGLICPLCRWGNKGSESPSARLQR